MKYWFWLVVDKLTHLTFRIPLPYRVYEVEREGEEFRFVKLGWRFSWLGLAWTNYPCNRFEEEFEKREGSKQ